MSAPNRTVSHAQTRKHPPSSTTLNQGFRDIFDATNGYTTKAAMPRLPLTDLMIGDLVLAECTAIRYKVDNAPAHQWDSWQVGFQLHALSLLHRRSETIAPPPSFFTDDFEGTL